MIVKEVRDGRRFGDRRPTKVTRFTRDGQAFEKRTTDSWEGPGSYDPDDDRFHPEGQYVRITRETKL